MNPLLYPFKFLHWLIYMPLAIIGQKWVAQGLFATFFVFLMAMQPRPGIPTDTAVYALCAAGIGLFFVHKLAGWLYPPRWWRARPATLRKPPPAKPIAAPKQKTPKPVKVKPPALAPIAKVATPSGYRAETVTRRLLELPPHLLDLLTTPHR